MTRKSKYAPMNTKYTVLYDNNRDIILRPNPHWHGYLHSWLGVPMPDPRPTVEVVTHGLYTAQTPKDFTPRCYRVFNHRFGFNTWYVWNVNTVFPGDEIGDDFDEEYIHCSLYRGWIRISL